MTGGVVVQCATPEEFGALRDAFGAPSVSVSGRRRHFDLGGVAVLRGSVGKVWAAASAEFAIARWRPRMLVDFGAAGGLAPGLRVGDIVVADAVWEHDYRAASGDDPVPVVMAGGRRLLTDRKLPKFSRFWTASDGLRFTRGAIAAGDCDVRSREERDELRRKLGAIAATWESSAVGRVCGLHRVPFASLRTITDVGNGAFLAEYREGAAKALPAAAAALAAFLRSKVDH